MPKIELRISDADKARMQAAADASQLRLATWAKAQLMLAAMGAGRGDYLRALTDVKDLADSTKYAGLGLNELIDELRNTQETPQ